MDILQPETVLNTDPVQLALNVYSVDILQSETVFHTDPVQLALDV